MPQSILLPTGEGYHAGGTYTGAGTYADVTSDDSDTSYWATQQAARSWIVADLPAEANLITEVSVVSKARLTGAGGGTRLQLLARLAGVDASSAGDDLTDTYTDYTYTPDTTPSEEAWTVAAVNAMEIGAQLTESAGADRLRVTYQRAAITYLVPAPAYAFIIWSWLGPVLGAGLGLEHLPGIFRAVRLATRGRHRLLASDAPDLLAGLLLPRRAYLL